MTGEVYPPNLLDSKMRGQAPLSPITGVPGWLTEDEQIVLLKHAELVPAGLTAVEIGSEMGGSASIMRKGLSDDCLLVCVEINAAAPAAHNLKAAGLNENVYFHYADSSETTWPHLVPVFRNKMDFLPPLSLLFIDGDHSEEGVIADLENWASYIALGGYLIMHDIAIDTNHTPHVQHHNVYRAYRRWIQGQPARRWRRVDAANRMLVMQRGWDGV